MSSTRVIQGSGTRESSEANQVAIHGSFDTVSIYRKSPDFRYQEERVMARQDAAPTGSFGDRGLE